jgi:hypothetical protein
MADEPVFIFLATYNAEADAQLDHATVKELHSAGVIGTYDTAAVTKDADGVIGHFWNGMSRKDVMELGEMLDDGATALLIVGKSKLDKELEKAEKEAQ